METLSKRSRPDGRPQSDQSLAVLEADATATNIVNTIRTFLESMIRSFSDQHCPVCFVITGSRCTNHASGDTCPFKLCTSTDWPAFCKQIRFSPSRSLCFACYLPTVCAHSSRCNHSLSLRQSQVKGHPGARPHVYSDCTTPHFIRPALYAFWEKAPDDLRRFVSYYTRFEQGSRADFIAWFSGEHLQTHLPNHLLLFWWIMVFWRVATDERCEV